jgi:pimeloyl-ACP methyl ester carboxylesterase/DNA-binding SARP family transcriptional activator
MPVSVRLMGEFAVEIDGRVIGADRFPRRSAASLMKLLALASNRRLHREQVMDALWPDASPQDAANQLHKAAHYARRATGERDCVSLRNEFVTLFPGWDVVVDVHRFEAAAQAALAGGDPQAALSLRTGELLPDHPYAAWAFQPRQRVQLLHRELLRRCGRWADVVALDPTDEQAHLGVAQAFLAAGDRAGALRQIDVLERILHDELGIGLSPEAYDLRIIALDTPVTAPAPTAAAPSPARHASLARQIVRCCHTPDGVRLAYATSGAGPPLVKAANWLSHLDYDWASPVWSHWWRELSERHLLVRYDERGCGLSDWSVDASSFTFDAWVRDLETVVDTLGLRRFPLLGISQGGPVAIAYAVRHPERVSHLVLLGTFAQGRRRRARTREELELAETRINLVRFGWGRAEATYRQLFVARFLPEGTQEQWRDFDELQRRSTSPENAWRFLDEFANIDVTELAPKVTVPTLILCAKREPDNMFEQSRLLAAQIPGSRLIPLDSANHLLPAQDPAWPLFLAELDAFLAPIPRANRRDP